MRHIWVMTTTSAIGLVGVFMVDLLDILFLSLLDSNDILAGIGFAATLSFFTLSLSIGITITMAALVSRTIGQGNPDQARRYVTHIVVLTLIITSLIAALIWVNLASLLSLLGASGDNLQVGVSYLQILLPSFPILTAGMAMSAALRAVGDAKLSMACTLVGSLVNALLDPLFIFTLGMGVEGAAVASVIARFFILAVAIYGVQRKHHLMAGFVYRRFVADLSAIFKILGPAVLTNMATPVGNAIVIKEMAQFGEAYIAGFAIIGRVSMVSFALVFALSGAIAPIFGQNFGAYNHQRIHQTLTDALKFNAIYVFLISVLLFFLQDFIIALFKLEGDAAAIMSLFCSWLAIAFIFNGVQFVANAAFNNLGKPVYAAGFNIAKSTLGTIPFVIIGGQLAGAAGVLVGQALGGLIFAMLAIVMVFRHIKQLAHNQQPA
jgi:putative MATE family efflux protein